MTIRYISAYYFHLGTSVSSGLRRRVIKNIESDSATGTVNVGVSSGTINVGTVQPGTVNVGIAGSTITLSGTTNVTALSSTSPTTTMTIGNNLTTGEFGMLNGTSFSGNVSIASNSATRTGTFQIATAGAGAITLGNVNAPLTLAGSTISLTGTTSVTTLNATTLNATTLNATALNATTATTTMTIGNNLTTGEFGMLNGTSFSGNVSIASNSATRTGTFQIATAGAGAITLGNVGAPLSLAGSSITIGTVGNGLTTIQNISAINGSTAGSNITIGSGLTGSSSLIAIGNPGAGQVSLGGYGTRTGTVFVGAGGTGAVNIGNSSAPLALNGLTTTFSSPLTLGSNPLSGITASGPTTYLGSLLTAVIPTAIPTNGSNIGSGITISTTGTYLFTFCIVIVSTTNPTSAYIIPGGTSTTIGFTTVNTQNISIAGSYVIANTAGTFGLQINYLGGTGLSLNASSYFQALRIA